MTANLIQISNDLFDIVNRLKEIDADYAVYYNAAASCFEVHSSRQRGNTLCLKVPYEKLDARTVDLVQATRVQNAKKLFLQMENDNAKLVRQSREAGQGL